MIKITIPFAWILYLGLTCMWPFEPLVEFQVRGGFAGIKKRLVIFINGIACVELDKRQATSKSLCMQLEENKLKEIKYNLEAARFEQLQPEYMPRHPVYDGYTYLITYKNVSVKTYDPFENAVPSGLGVVIRLLREVMHSVESSGKSCDNLF